jgi:Protein of unknown function (DUF2905)
VLKWLLAALLIVLLLARTPIAKKMHLGDLPGDLRFQYKRFKLHLPLASTLLIVALLWVFKRFI